VKEAGMVPAFHSKAVSHGKNVQATNSRAGTVDALDCLTLSKPRWATTRQQSHCQVCFQYLF
jgi:hypothetical protein